jgi:glutathione S-transferase
VHQEYFFLISKRPIGLLLSNFVFSLFKESTMPTLYYNPISPNARRVWIAALEKGVEFEPMIIHLDGDQMGADFLAVNPFHHIPVWVEGNLRIVESLAVLDYLEKKYPTPALLPQNAEDIAIVRMVQLITANELFPELVYLIYERPDSELFAQAQQNVETVLGVLVNLLGDRPYFGNESLTLADIVAGTAFQLFPGLDISLQPHPTLQAWRDRLMARPVWAATQYQPTDLDRFKQRVRALVRLRRRRWSKP